MTQFNFITVFNVDLGNKQVKKKPSSELGRNLIFKMGPASVILSYLNKVERQRFNLLCKYAYNNILPSISGHTPIRPPIRNWSDWLRWGLRTSTRFKATISGVKGSYMGECSKS